MRSLLLAFLSSSSLLRRFRFALLALRLALGLLVVVVVSLRQFCRFGIGSSYVRCFRVCFLLFGASCGDRSSKLTMF